jgi:hypothetical protein
MKVKLPHPEHYSYQLHRKQRVTQIILPVVIAALLMVGMIVLLSLVSSNGGGDVSRWAAISTIWIIIPIMVVGVIFLAIIIGFIYLMTLLMATLPYYSGRAQDYVYIARGYIIRWADMAVKPIIALGGYLETIRAFLERITNL